MFGKTYETPSSVSSYAYCPRLGYLTKLFPGGNQRSPALTLGNVEHTAFQEYYKLFKLDCINLKEEILDDSKQYQVTIDKVVEYTTQFFSTQNPSYHQHIIDEVPSIKFRLSSHHDQKIEEIKKHIKSNVSFKQAVDFALPFEIEKNLSGYGLFGRVDCIYLSQDSKGNKRIIPEDIKSHGNRFDSLIHQSSHKIQIILYALLLELEYKIPVNYGRILYSKDLTYETFRITKNDKVHALELKDECQKILNQGLPEVLEEKIFCDHCYRKFLCKEIADRGISDPSEYIPLEDEVDE